MGRCRRFAAVVVVVLVVGPLIAWSNVGMGPSEAKVRALRERGPDGLKVALDEYAMATQPAEKAAWRKAIDTIAGQRDAVASRLFWYTNLDEAKAAAKREGKAILSLRLLGRLDTELSCANSRFFRVTLYPDPEVNKLLREKFVLHWESVRPVPVVTIDMGDGREIKRTITGNSIHYVLDADGRVIDGLPGLYSAKAFVAGLNDALELVSLDDAALRAAHANAAKRLGEAKPAVEPVQFSQPVRDLIVAKATPPAPAPAFPARVAVVRAVSKLRAESPLLRQIAGLQTSIAQDTIYNEYTLHRQLHEWLAGDARTFGLPVLNAKVYAELFLTPSTDPWLGLVPADAFSAIEADGLASK